jgi:hypothetical protein
LAFQNPAIAGNFLLLSLPFALAAYSQDALTQGARIDTDLRTRRVALPAPGPFEIRLPSRSFAPAAERPDWPALFARPEVREVHAIVQFSSIPSDQTRGALQSAGLVLGQPLTGRAYIAKIRRDIQTSSPALRTIRWLGPLLPDDKIARQLLQPELAPWARRTPGRVELVVKLFPDADLDAAVELSKRLGGAVLGEARAASTFTLSLPAGREPELAALDAVRFIEPMLPPGVGESDRARAHVGADVGAIPVNRANGNGVTVAVFDYTHASTTHPDFGNRLVQGDSGAFVAGQHATMTAGMIAGNGSQSLNQGAGTANRWRGLAPAAQVRSYNFTNSPDPVTGFLNDVTDAVQNGGVHALNNSWGDPGCTPFAYGSYAGRVPFLDGVVRGSLGRPVTIVFSAGNERDGFGANNDRSCLADRAVPFNNYTTINHPKAAKNVIVVGAVDSFNNAMTDYSSWGPTLDGRLKPDVVASGQHNGTMAAGVSQITNAFGQPPGAADQQDYRVPNFPTNQFVYAWFAQTSSAAAVVSGGIAVMLDAWRRAFPSRADPLPSTVRALLVHNARDLDDPTTWYNPGPDYASGYGLVQINDTIQSLERHDASEDSVPHQGEVRFSFNLPAGAARVKITLAWDDPPAVDGANPALINDLDLVVTDPGGTRRYPWTLDPANPSANALQNREDHVNNLEQVSVYAPSAGTWTVAVRGTNLAQGPQTFSIVGIPRTPAPPQNLQVR